MINSVSFPISSKVFFVIKLKVNSGKCWHVTFSSKLGIFKKFTVIRIFKYAAVVTALSSLIGSISCAIICLIFIVKRCESISNFF